MDDKSEAKPTESLDAIRFYPGLFGGTAKDTAVVGTFFWREQMIACPTKTETNHFPHTTW